jgi:hypothetical protein
VDVVACTPWTTAARIEDDFHAIACRRHRGAGKRAGSGENINCLVVAWNERAAQSKKGPATASAEGQSVHQQTRQMGERGKG